MSKQRIPGEDLAACVCVCVVDSVCMGLWGAVGINQCVGDCNAAYGQLFVMVWQLLKQPSAAKHQSHCNGGHIQCSCLEALRTFKAFQVSSIGRVLSTLCW